MGMVRGGTKSEGGGKVQCSTRTKGPSPDTGGDTREG